MLQFIQSNTSIYLKTNILPMKWILLSVLWLVTDLQTFAQSNTERIQLGSTSIRFQQTCGQPQPGISWLHVHENETTAVATAKALIDSLHLGCFVTWQHSGDRYVSYQLAGKQYKFDPNRIYTPKGLAATLKANGHYSTKGYKAAQQLADAFIRKYVAGNRLVIAMHNNSDGGGLHIKSYLPGGDYANDAAEVYVNEAADIDDFFYTTDKRIFDFLKAKGFNILLQNNATVTDDGSLSVYCGNQQMAYLNIEAQQGHLAEQKAMMLAVYEMIRALF